MCLLWCVSSVYIFFLLLGLFLVYLMLYMTRGLTFIWQKGTSPYDTLNATSNMTHCHCVTLKRQSTHHVVLNRIKLFRNPPAVMTLSVSRDTYKILSSSRRTVKFFLNPYKFHFLRNAGRIIWFQWYN